MREPPSMLTTLFLTCKFQ